MKWGVTCISIIALLAGCGAPPEPPADPRALSWPEIEAQARGSAVNLIMWMGDPFINQYIRDYVATQLKERYDIRLEVQSGQGNQIVTLLMTEQEAGKTASAFDMMWINGETFYQLRQLNALFGPFTDTLPNSQYIDFENPFIGVDFQQPTEGYESPWGNVQLAIIYDSARTPDPPRNREALAAWVRANPGRFTFDTQFTGMTFLKSLMIDLAGGPGALDGPFDEARYQRGSTLLWEYLNGLKPFLWRRGESFPNGVAQLHQMFANGEVDFTMSNNDGEVDNKVIQGLFPDTARAFVLDGGTIQNSHYMGVPKRAPNKAAAMVAINFMISLEAQLHKMDPAVWGDGTVLDMDKVPLEWRAKFRNLPTRRHAPPRETIQDKALMELAPEYMIRLYEDFRKHVIEG